MYNNLKHSLGNYKDSMAELLIFFVSNVRLKAKKYKSIDYRLQS